MPTEMRDIYLSWNRFFYYDISTRNPSLAITSVPVPTITNIAEIIYLLTPKNNIISCISPRRLIFNGTCSVPYAIMYYVCNQNQTPEFRKAAFYVQITRSQLIGSGTFNVLSNLSFYKACCGIFVLSKVYSFQASC
jgi:hypothetical protein